MQIAQPLLDAVRAADRFTCRQCPAAGEMIACRDETTVHLVNHAWLYRDTRLRLDYSCGCQGTLFEPRKWNKEHAEYEVLSLQGTPSSWLPLVRPLFAVSLDPYSLHELKRGFLSIGTLVEEPEQVLRDAAMRHIGIVTVRVRANAASEHIHVERVSVEALRSALGS